MERNDTVAWKDKYDGFRRWKQAAIKLQKEKKLEKQSTATSFEKF